MKKILSLLLTMSILLYIIPQAIYAADAPGTVYSAAEAELAITRSDGTVTASYSGAGFGAGDMIILASYNAGGTVQDVKMQPLSQSKTVSLPNENGKYYKAFAFDPQTMTPLCDSVIDGDVYSETVEVPLIDGAEAEAVTTAVRRYGDARLMVEKLAGSDITAVEGDSKKLSEYMAMIHDAIAAYDDVMQAAAVLDAVSDKSIELETAALAGETEQAFSVQATKDEQLHWAEEFTKKYDSIRAFL
ncbi:MAG: hypothetical protein IJH37_06845 [Clostridia bacterium]|nr:hypothetical protein [Clostridia bacterium]